jgi:hypothetical protein
VSPDKTGPQFAAGRPWSRPNVARAARAFGYSRSHQAHRRCPILLTVPKFTIANVQKNWPRLGAEFELGPSPVVGRNHRWPRLPLQPTTNSGALLTFAHCPKLSGLVTKLGELYLLSARRVARPATWILCAVPASSLPAAPSAYPQPNALRPASISRATLPSAGYCPGVHLAGQIPLITYADLLHFGVGTAMIRGAPVHRS